MSATAAAPQAFDAVLAAMNMMQSNVGQDQKKAAHEFLENFQKSPEAWEATFNILQSATAPADAKLFAATTLKGKIMYDLGQIPVDAHAPLRDSLFNLLKQPYDAGSKPIRTQLSVCLADLAIQMLQWKDVLDLVITELGSSEQYVGCMLQFLVVLPEEINESRKINLSEDDLAMRTIELLQEKKYRVLEYLVQYSRSSPAAAKNPLLLDAISSWLKEIPIKDIADSPLLDVVIGGLADEDSFDASVECLCSMFRETREVDENAESIEKIHPRIMDARWMIEVAANADDEGESLKGMARLYSEAGEAWAVLIARMPARFGQLVATIVEVCKRDKNKEAIRATFWFWYALRELLTLDRYIEARDQYKPLWSELLDVMIKHLEFPKPESGSEADLFDGDRELEESFRALRHSIGEVLKDCCEVLGVVDCLQKPYQLIQQWIQANGHRLQPGFVPEWQSLEAPLFSMRTMGRMVPPDENFMLPNLIPLIVQMPDHPKLRFQAVMVLGRYTAWTALHTETLESQRKFIMDAFQHPSKDVAEAAALSFQYFCLDCAKHLQPNVADFKKLYHEQIPRLRHHSREEITVGVAKIINIQPLDQVYHWFKEYCDPLLKMIEELAQKALATGDEESQNDLADHIKLVGLFIENIHPRVDSTTPNPAVEYCKDMLPGLEKLNEMFPTSGPVLEQLVGYCWRKMINSYRTGAAPLIPQLAPALINGYAATGQGCFLWTSGAVVREFSGGADNVDAATLGQVFEFAMQQSKTFLQRLRQILSQNPSQNSKLVDVADQIEDYFRMMDEVMAFFPKQLLEWKSVDGIESIDGILSAVCESLVLEKQRALEQVLRFLRAFQRHGGPTSPVSLYDGPAPPNPPEVRQMVHQLSLKHGEQLMRGLFIGMMYTFPEGCFGEASAAILGFFELVPEAAFEWLQKTLSLLPGGMPAEGQRLLSKIQQRFQEGKQDLLRGVLQDFTRSYRRRNVAPREGLGAL